VGYSGCERRLITHVVGCVCGGEPETGSHKTTSTHRPTSPSLGLKCTRSERAGVLESAGEGEPWYVVGVELIRGGAMRGISHRCQPGPHTRVCGRGKEK
jgi:hypothetical protein